MEIELNLIFLGYFNFLKNVLILEGERKGEGEREREKDGFVVALIHAFVGGFLYVP